MKNPTFASDSLGHDEVDGKGCCGTFTWLNGFNLCCNECGAKLSDTVLARLSQYEGLVEEAEKVIEILGSCEHDHHGNCQAHFVESPCSVTNLKTALGRVKG